MKTRNKLLTLFCALFAFFLGTGAWFYNVIAPKAQTPNVTLQADALEESYSFGQTLEIPQGTLVIDGNTHEAESVVIFPSGNAYNQKEIKLTETGVYTVEYRAVADGELYSQERTFKTLENLYTVSSERSSIRYGKPSDLGINFTTEQSPAGLCVSLAKGDEFRYNSVIDVRNSTKLNRFLRMYLTPQISKAMDAASMYIKLTDIYDPNNYVMISVWSYNSKATDGWQCREAFITTCVPSVGQNYTAHYSTYHTGGGSWRDVIWKNTRQSGFSTYVNFYGDNANGTPYWDSGVGDAGNGIKYDWGYTGQNSLDFWWNYDERQIYTNQPEPLFTQANGRLSELLADYDSYDYYASSQWNGFTTGECYMSIYADDYNNSSFNFVVTQVDGMNLSENEPETSYEDTAAPTINVDYGKYNEGNYPNAKVGATYPVFTAQGLDGYDGATEVYARAFYGYGTASCYELTCKDTFIPDRAGEFTIVYTSKDRAKNKAEKLVRITAEVDAPAISLNVEDNSVIKTGVVGSFVDVAPVTYGGGVGELICTIIAKNRSTDSIYEVKENRFRPMDGGTFDVIYTVKDFIGQEETYSYTVEVEGSSALIFNDVPTLPKYFISGYYYTLPTVSANAQSGEILPANISVKVDGTALEMEDGRVLIEGNGVAEVIYSATKGSDKAELKFNIPVIDVKSGTRIDCGKYFVGEGFTATSTSANTTLTANDGVTKASATYANAILAEGFTVDMEIKGTGFSELALYLTDSENNEEQIKFSWVNTNGTNYLYINDKISAVVTEFGFNGAKSNFVWLNETKTFKDISTNLSAAVEKTLKGKAFSGFTSGKVYVTLEMVGVNGEASVSVTNINNQAIGLRARDVIDPQMTLLGGAYTTQGLVGDKIALKDCVVADVLSPETSVLLTVKDPDGNAITSDDGTSLNYSDRLSGSFTLQKKGQYQIVYTVSDGSRRVEYTYVISCGFKNSISINLQSEMPTTGTVGQVITLPKANCVAVEGTATGYILLVDTHGKFFDITSSRTFTPDTAGLYLVVYTAYDQSNNVCTDYYQIIVK